MSESAKLPWPGRLVEIRAALELDDVVALLVIELPEDAVPERHAGRRITVELDAVGLAGFALLAADHGLGAPVE